MVAFLKADLYIMITIYYINKYIQKVTTLGYQLAMIIHDNFQFHSPCSIGEEDH